MLVELAIEPFGSTERQKPHRAFDRKCVFEGVFCAIAVPRTRPELGEVERKQRLPCGTLRQRRAACERALAELAVARLGGEELEHQEVRNVVRGSFGRLLGESSRARRVVLVIGQEKCTVDERARALVRREGNLRQSLEKLAEILVGLPALDDRDESFERFGEFRFGIDGCQLVAGCRGLVAGRLFEHADFVEERRFARGCLTGRLLGADLRDRGEHERRILRLLCRLCAGGCCARHRKPQARGELGKPRIVPPWPAWEPVVRGSAAPASSAQNARFRARYRAPRSFN